VYYYDGAQRYEQFLQVGRLYWALILLGLTLSSKRLCFFVLHGALYIFLLTSFSLPFSELSLVGLAFIYIHIFISLKKWYSSKNTYNIINKENTISKHKVNTTIISL